MELLTKKKNIVSTFLKHNILVNRELLERLNQPNIVEEWHSELARGKLPHELMIVPENQGQITKESLESVQVLMDYQDPPNKRCVQDFVGYFNARYKSIQKILSQRQELQNLTSISRIAAKNGSDSASIIGIVYDKRITKNEHLMLSLEDSTGTINVLIRKSDQQLFAQAQDLVFDEVIGISGKTGEGIIFAEKIVIPDIPIGEIKKSQDETYIAILSCVHVGSAQFEHERFANFLAWTNGEHGKPEEREIAKKLKYIFICGDVVDGVGIYPEQDKQLSIIDIKEQYAECARLLSKIPKNITLVICPGNHDVGRISEPQPKLAKIYTQPLWDLPNAIMVCNPCFLNIHATEEFSGFNTLMYHGYSFDDYSEIVPSIKNSGAHISDRAALVMKFLLQRRHLAPQHSSTLYIPDPRADPLVIEKVPDLFFAGHIHKAGTLNYRTTTIIAGSCFQGKTDFQEKVGHDPEPGVVPVLNTKTRVVQFMRF